MHLLPDLQIFTAQGAPIDLGNVDVAVTNGLIHLVDEVMFPPSETIYQLFLNNPDFSTLLSTIDVADLGETLNGVYN